MSSRVTLVLAQDQVRATRWAQTHGFGRNEWRYVDTYRRMLPLSGPAVRIVKLSNWTAGRTAEELGLIRHRLIMLEASGAEIVEWDEGELSARDAERVRLGQAAVCPRCDRVIRIGIPPRGDGTARRFATHGPVNARCPWSRRWAPGWSMQD